MAEIGSNLVDMIEKYGEDITLIKPVYDSETKTYDKASPEIYHLKMSTLPATKAAYNPVDREYMFTKEVTLPELPQGEQMSDLRGCYLVRDIVPNKKYLLESLILEPTAPKEMAIFYMMQCNEYIEIQVEGKVTDKFGNKVDGWKPFASVCGYGNTELRSQDKMQDGYFDRNIYTIVVPSRYKVSGGMRIVKKTFHEGEIAKMAYRVESIDTTLTEFSEDTDEIFGVTSCQLSKGVVIKNEQDNGSEI